MRTAAFGWIELLAARSYAALAARSGWSEQQLAQAMAPYWAEHAYVGIDAEARATALFSLAEEPGRWVVTQRIVDPAGDGEWRMIAAIDLAIAEAEGAPTLVLEQLGTWLDP